MTVPRTVKVPLAVDAQVRVPVGPMLMPLRAVILVAVAAPFAYLCFSLPHVATQYRVGLAMMILALAFTFSTPTRQGVWIGTYQTYRWLNHVFPTAILRGTAVRAHVSRIGSAVQVSGAVDAGAGSVTAFLRKVPQLRQLMDEYSAVPRGVADPNIEGLFNLTPGGARAVIRIDGPSVAISSEAYVIWCHQVVAWLTTIGCPAQLLTVLTHYDSRRAQEAYDKRTEAWPSSRLRYAERDLCGGIASTSLGLVHYVILSPGLCGPDGIPFMGNLRTASQYVEPSSIDAERYLGSAMRTAPTFGLEPHIPDTQEINRMLAQSIVGAQDAAVADDGTLHIGDQHHVQLTCTKLPPRIEAGAIVEALMRARIQGIASLHILPVDPVSARKTLNKQTAVYRYAQRQGSGDIDTQVAMQDVQGVLASIAQREMRPFRVALNITLSHHDLTQAQAASERLDGLLQGNGIETVQPTVPGFIPALAMAPGWVPLTRSLILTSDAVVARMIPALGTPFSDFRAPLVGSSALTGAPVYFSIWTRPNHNMVIVGSSGAGKSVATKTLLIRHVMEGVSAVVIDPDSEYQNVMTAIGGSYYELGTEALNPLAAGINVPPDTAASLIMPILSVMGGDEKGIKDGRPIRRLPDEDQGWLHAELADFFRGWNAMEHPDGNEPVLHELILFIETQSRARALTEKEVDRCRIITARLRRYTQGKRALVFDRPSTFHVGRQPVGIGLKVFAMSYGADLTPALAVVLTSILAAIDKRQGRMIVVVDEAHRVTSDPDAGEVLGQLVRQVRKYGAGVWMCSQQVEDFVNTDLGRTLAATASTKLILGAEEAAVEIVTDVFKLREEEVGAISPIMRGRGVLISGGERTVVNIIPGPAIMSLSDTSSALAGLDMLTNKAEEGVA